MKHGLKFNSSKFSADIILMRSNAGLSVRAASNQIGISAASLSRVENGKLPDLLTFASIGKWMGCKNLESYFYEPLRLEHV